MKYIPIAQKRAKARLFNRVRAGIIAMMLLSTLYMLASLSMLIDILF